MSEKKKIGRPRVDTESINLRLPREMIEAIDDRRREEPDLPTRPEMIRRLLMTALNLEEDN
ncbi:Ribbon-helix-helix protein, copG family [Paracoccus halophilus]|uniref:Ribbon-helix-helix protein, copG family n=1 Tax=Paracoccus halophilus TaxID=376733 RepID=A0A1I0UF33_9RHOB|nr:Ribbon-helix-helix protein, copG family [Paracoccus halophilus]